MTLLLIFPLHNLTMSFEIRLICQPSCNDKNKTSWKHTFWRSPLGTQKSSKAKNFYLATTSLTLVKSKANQKHVLLCNVWCKKNRICSFNFKCIEQHDGRILILYSRLFKKIYCILSKNRLNYDFLIIQKYFLCQSL